MRQAGSGILESHCPRQPEGFLSADIGSHAHAADGRPAGDVVDRDDRLEPDGRSVNVGPVSGAEVVGEAKYILHYMPSESLMASRATRSAIRLR